MSIIELPPKIKNEDLFDVMINNLQKELSEVIDKINENYEYWDSVKYKKCPEGISSEKLWTYVKSSRMKKILFYIQLLISTLYLSSCSVIWDMTVMPFVKYEIDESDIKWSKYYPECDYLFYDIDSSLRDIFIYDEKYCTNRWRLKYNTAASQIQTIMFDKNGNCVGGYELCYGNAKTLDVYDEVPIFQRNIYNDTIFDIVNLKNYVDILDTDHVEKEYITRTIEEYDYNIVVVWDYYAGYYMKRHLRQVKKYIKRFNTMYKFRIIYLNV